MKSFLIKGAVVVLLPMLIGLLSNIYTIVVDYSRLQAQVKARFESDEKKDALIERRLESMDNKLDILLLSRSQLNRKLEKIINDNSDKEGH